MLIFEEENSSKMHETVNTVDPSQLTSQVYGPSGHVREVQVANHSSSLVVQTREKVNIVVTKSNKLAEAIYRGLIVVPIGHMITHFPMPMSL